MTYLYNATETKDVRRRLRSSITDAEQTLWKQLRRQQVSGFRFLRQYAVGNYILDFYCPSLRLAVEVDGGQHSETSQQTHDEQRTLYLKKENIRVLRFWNNEVMQNMDGVLQTISSIAERPRSNPSSPPLVPRGGNGATPPLEQGSLPAGRQG